MPRRPPSSRPITAACRTHSDSARRGREWSAGDGAARHSPSPFYDRLLVAGIEVETPAVLRPGQCPRGPASDWLVIAAQGSRGLRGADGAPESRELQDRVVARGAGGPGGAGGNGSAGGPADARTGHDRRAAEDVSCRAGGRAGAAAKAATVATAARRAGGKAAHRARERSALCGGTAVPRDLGRKSPTPDVSRQQAADRDRATHDIWGMRIPRRWRS